MSMITLMRLYLRYQNLPRLPVPCIGYAGTLYSAPLIDRQRYALKDSYESTTASPELGGTTKLVCKSGAIGSYFFRRGYSTSVGDIKKAEKARLDKNKFKLRSVETIKVMVVSETGSISAMTLEEAGKLAKKKGFNLVHVTNPKDKPVRTEKEVYKLVSKLASVGEDEEEGEGMTGDERSVGIKVPGDDKPKEVKTVLMKSNTGEHDINAKINSMKKWIKKGHRIRVQISQAGDKGSAEAVFKNIETQMAEVEGQVQQKITKGNELRFYIGPPKKSKVVNKSPPKNKGSKDNSSSKDSDANEDDDDSSDDEEEGTKSKRKVNRA